MQYYVYRSISDKLRGIGCLWLLRMGSLFNDKKTTIKGLEMAERLANSYNDDEMYGMYHIHYRGITFYKRRDV